MCVAVANNQEDNVVPPMANLWIQGNDVIHMMK